MRHKIAFAAALSVLAAVSVAMLLGHIRGQEDEEPLPSRMLTVEETVGLARSESRCLGAPGAQARDPEGRLILFNPMAREGLYSLLNDAEHPECWVNAILLIGQVATAEDVERLVGFIQGCGVLPDGLSFEQQLAAVRAVFEVLAGMCRKGVPGAKDALRDMLHPAYWQKVAFRHDTEPGTRTFENWMLTDVLEAYAQIGDPEFPTIAERMLDEIEDPAQREMMRQEVRWVIKRYGSHTKRLQSADHGIRPGEIKKSANGHTLPETQQGQMHTGTSGGPGVLDDETSVIVGAAIAAYEGARDVFIEGRYEEAVPHLADNGEPLIHPSRQTPDRIKAVAADMRKAPQAMEKTAAVLRALKEARCPYGRGEVAFSRTCTFEGWKADEQKAIKPTCRETLTVLITLEGSASIGKAHLRMDAPGRTMWSNQEGNLVVWMVKVGDTWYWNPFGW